MSQLLSFLYEVPGTIDSLTKTLIPVVANPIKVAEISCYRPVGTRLQVCVLTRTIVILDINQLILMYFWKGVLNFFYNWIS